MNVHDHRWCFYRSLSLLICVLLTLQKRIQFRKTYFFLTCHILIWPYGAISLISEADWTRNFAYSDNYVIHNGCTANFSFVLTADGSDCLLPYAKRYFYLAFYLIYFIMTLSSVVIFMVVLKLASNIYSKRRISLLRSPSSIEHSVAKDHSYIIRKTTLRFAVTSFAYIICFIPLLAVEISNSLYGPFNQNMTLVYGIFYGLFQPLLASINIMVYGYFSRAFRLEVKSLLGKISSVLRKNKLRRGHSLSRSNLYEEIQ